MKTRNFYLFGFLFLLAAMLLPQVDQWMALPGMDDGGTTLMMAGGAAFAPLKWQMGQNNMGGYKPRLLFIPADAVSAIPQVPKPEEATDNVDLVTATGTFEFVAGGSVTKPIYLYSTDGEVEYKAETQGEVDGISYKQTLSFFFPGNLPEMHAFSALVKNTPGYYVIEDVDGRQLMVGQDGLMASTAPSFNGGKARADRRGTTFTATADSNYSAIFLATPLDMAVIGGFKSEETGG